MPDRLEVRADLVRAPRLEAHAQQRRRRQRLLELEVRARRARRVGVDRHARARAAVAPERRVDRAAARGRAALDERQVLAHDLARRERRLQAPVRLLALGDDEQARGVAVEAVHDPGPPRLAAGRAARARAPARACRSRCGPAGCTTTPAGFSTTSSVGVLVGDREVGAARRAGVRRGDRRGATTIVSPPRRRSFLRAGRAVERHRARVDPPLRLRARAERARRGTGRGARRPPQAERAAAPPRPTTRTSVSTPSVIAVSATLNAGQCGSLMKSVTEPDAHAGRAGCRARRRRSGRTRATSSGRSRWRAK